MLPLRPVGTAELPPVQTAVVTQLTTLEDVLRRPELTFLDVIVQDEYTHDVVVGAGAQFVVFDATWLGGLVAVSVWDHRPTADELLDDRLAHGWVATPTGTVDGPQILGHAACRLER